MKLGTKIAGGFGIVLVLTAVVGYVGYSGLSGVTTIVDKADDGNRMVKQIQAARQQEKNFILRSDPQYITKVDEEVQGLLTQARTTKEKMEDAADRAQMETVATSTQDYKTAFDSYVTLAANKDKAVENMVTAARTLQSVADTIRAEQKDELALVLDAQHHIADGSRAHLSWAGTVKDFLADKSSALNVETNGHNCGFGKWLDSQAYTNEAVACGQQFRQIIENVKQKHLDLHARRY